MLDVACGYGRHARWFYERNHPVALVDRSQAAIDSIAAVIPANACEAVVVDLENGPWPFVGRQFAAVIVTNYLWRPLFSSLLGGLQPGGVLIYETFTQGNETVGKPSRADFLLRPGELLEVCQALCVVAFEEGFQQAADGTAPRFIQRIAAVRATDTGAAPARYALP